MPRRQVRWYQDPVTLGATAAGAGLLAFVAYHVGRSHQGEDDRRTLLALVGAQDASSDGERDLQDFAERQ